MKFEASPELKLYIKEVEKDSSPLTRDEEEILIPLAKEGNRKAQSRIVKSCAMFIIKTSNKYMGQGVSVIDMVQEGNLGVLEAIDRYDESSKSRFFSYASFWIKKYINDSVATYGRIVRLPMNHEFEIFKQKKAGEETVNLNTLRLDAPVKEDSKATIGDIYLKVESNVFKDEDKSEQAVAVNLYLNKITNNRDREIVKAYFGIDREFALPGKELADEFGLTPVRVSQIVNSALKKIRNN